jgi:hypothetical protein
VFRTTCSVPPASRQLQVLNHFIWYLTRNILPKLLEHYLKCSAEASDAASGERATQ